MHGRANTTDFSIVLRPASLAPVNAEPIQLNTDFFLARRRAALTVLMMVPVVLGPWTPEVLDQLGLSLATVQAGEYWRMFTAHWAHVSWAHVGLNVLALFLLQLLFGGQIGSGIASVAIIWLSLAVSGGLLLEGESGLYVGLSGVLHGLYVLGACLAWQHDRWLAGSVSLLLIGKVGLEQWRGPATGMADLIGAPVAIDAHLYGLVAGCALAAFLQLAAAVKSRLT